MIGVTLNMHQEDCPLTQATVDHDIQFITPYWRFLRDAGRWELRVHANASGRAELEEGLQALRSADPMQEFSLVSKRGGTAHVRTVFDETTAIATITEHDGFVTGPFHNIDGRERWHLGFDESSSLDTALAALARHENFTVTEQHSVGDESLFAALERYDAADAVLSGCRRLTTTEQRVLRTAFDHGYFDTPRDETLGSLGERLGVSDAAVSKTLRRAERKLLEPMLTTLDSLDELEEG